MQEPRRQQLSSQQDTPLFDLVFQRISKSPDLSINFSEYMEMALYHEDHGYYSRGETRMVGRGGDFYTSVSVGETFGFLLARRVLIEWQTRFDGSEPLVIVEQGAHDGRLARDIMSGIREVAPHLLGRIEYRIVEPRFRLREVLKEQLAGEGSGQSIRVVDSLEQAKAPQGVFLCNELLDAFPVPLLTFQSGRWQEKGVGHNEEGDGFDWVCRPLSGEFLSLVEELGNDFPEEYVTELCPAVDDWMAEAGRLFENGLWWIIDYGYEREDYYLPQRRTGTLRCYREHRAGEDPLVLPGQQDITAHVDFTRLERAAERAGLKRCRFTDQHHFLIEAAKPWLLSLEGRPPDSLTAKRLRQFQTLTHPSLMGQQFKVMELSRGA